MRLIYCCIFLILFACNANSATRIFFEDCEDVVYSEHFLEDNYGLSTDAEPTYPWTNFKLDVSQSTQHKNGAHSLTYDPFTTGNPYAQVGNGIVDYGNLSDFSLPNYNGRYWYFRWYQRWETGISWTGSVENKILYINYQDSGDFTFIIHRNSSDGFHIYAKDRATYEIIFNHYASTGSSLDDETWHKLELYIDAGTTGSNNGAYWFKVDGVNIRSITGISYNSTIHSNPMHHLTGWPSNISGTASGTCNTWLDDLEIYTLTGPDDIPGGSNSGKLQAGPGTIQAGPGTFQ